MQRVYDLENLMFEPWMSQWRGSGKSNFMFNILKEMVEKDPEFAKLIEFQTFDDSEGFTALRFYDEYKAERIRGQVRHNLKVIDSLGELGLFGAEPKAEQEQPQRGADANKNPRALRKNNPSYQRMSNNGRGRRF